MARCESIYGPTPLLRGRPIRCDDAAGHVARLGTEHGNSYAARYWDGPDRMTFSDLAIGQAFSFCGGFSLADRTGYVKRSARGWAHPVYGAGRVGSIRVMVEPA